MKNVFSRANRLLDTFISPSGVGMAEHNRRRLFVVFLIASILPLIIFGSIHILNGLYLYGVIDYIVALVLSGFIMMMRIFETGKVLYRIAAIICMILFGYWIMKGVAQGYASLWVMAYPPFVFFLLGKKEGSFWSIAMAAMTFVIFIDPFPNLSSFRYETDFISRHLFTMFMVFCFTYNYESVRERSENELRKHHEQLEELVAERTRDLQKNNEELQASEKRYRFLADNVNDLIWATDANLNYTYISPSVENIFGYDIEEAWKLKLDQLYTDDSRRKILMEYHKLMDLEKQEGPYPDRSVFVQIEQINKDGDIVDIEVKVACVRDAGGKLVGFVGIARDISERIRNERDRERFQKQLLQAQKMELVGTLAGGLAHDFNNILGGIMGSFDLLESNLGKERLNNKENISRCLHIGMQSSKRAANLIRQLLAMSRKHEIRPSVIDINDSLRNINELCRSTFDKSISLDFYIDTKPLMIMGDMAQIEQVLLNLCINASHAMTIMRPAGEKQGGRLMIKAQEITPDKISREFCPEMEYSQGPWARIIISDTGVGMDDQTRQRIFEPFYSKKSQHEGTGLGLATSYNIIIKHGGVIHVESEPGKGACFTVYFPSLADGKKVDQGRDRDSRMIMGQGTVLAIDDETIILDVAKGILEQCGYEVLTSNTADEGIELYRQNHHLIDGVLLDLAMPGKNGLEVFEELRAVNPDVRVILASGMIDSKTRMLASEMGIRDIVNKPFLAEDLSARINAVLHG